MSYRTSVRQVMPSMLAIQRAVTLFLVGLFLYMPISIAFAADAAAVSESAKIDAGQARSQVAPSQEESADSLDPALENSKQTRTADPSLAAPGADNPDQKKADASAPAKVEGVQANATGGLTKILDDRQNAKTNIPNVNQATGALTFSYPIMMPPGRNGMHPDVSLNYNSQDKNIFSPYGYGWSLSIPWIKRYQATGAENQYSTNTYEFSLGGKLVLSQNQPADGGQNFETRTEDGMNWQLLFKDDQWTVRDNAGHTYMFGATAASRQDNPQWGTYAWMLSDLSDANANSIRYFYVKGSGQIYPEHIDYTYHANGSAIYKVQFEWGSAPYPRTSYQAGFKVVTEQRLSKISVLANGSVVHRYTIGYQSSISNVITLVAYIHEEYVDSQGVLIAKPDTTFEYPATSEVTGWQVTDQIQFPISYVDKGIRLGEFTGDGLTDFMYGSNLYVNGGSSWGATNPNNPPYVSNPMSGYNDGSEMADFNADGLLDYVLVSGNVQTNPSYLHSAYFYNNTGGGFVQDTTNPQTPPQVTTSNCNYSPPCDHAGLRVLDLNADGLTDMVQGFRFSRYNGGNTDYYINRTHLGKLDATGKIGWQEKPWGTIPVFEYEASGSAKHEILEMNGDGLPDLLYFAYYTDSQPRYSIYDYYVNNGIGWDYSGRGSTIPSDVSSLTNKRVADINGDGLDDMVVAANYYSVSCYSDCDHIRRVFVGSGDYLDEATSSWQLPDSLYFMRSTSQYSIDTDINPYGAVADVNGDGAPDIIVFQAGTQSIYLNKSAYAYLPKKITMPEGGSISFSYKPAVQYRGQNGAWVNSIPFPLITVEKVTTDDAFGTSGTDTYFYENGAYVSRNQAITDPRFMLERSVTFGKVTRTRSDGSKDISYYHQGNGDAQYESGDDIAKTGRLYRQEWYNSNGGMLKAVTTKWVKDDLFGAAQYGHWFLHPESSVTLIYGTGGTHQDSAIGYVYDPQSFVVTAQTSYGEVQAVLDGSFTDSGNDRIVTVRSYVANPLLSSLAAVETVTDQAGNKLAETKNYFDNLGALQATAGNLTRQEKWIAGSVYAATQKSYNNLGLVLTETDPRGFVTTYAYDSYKMYPASSTNALNQVTQFVYAYAVGKPQQITHPNGAVMVMLYDSLGRLTQEKIPDPVTGIQVIKSLISYSEASGNVSTTLIEYHDGSISRQTTGYFDGLGRQVQIRQQAEGVNVVVIDTSHDSVGRVSKQSLPYFSTGFSRTSPTQTQALYTVSTYDGLDREIAKSTSVGSYVYAYNGWTTTITDPNGNRKDTTIDAFGRLAKVVEYNQNQVYNTRYGYDGLGRLVNMIDAQNNTRNFSYDGLGRRISAEDLHASGDATFGVWWFAYDANGNQISKLDPNNQTTNYSYDELNRVTSEDFTDQTGTEVSYTYDTCGNGVGQVCSIVNASLTENRNYNLLGQVIQSAKVIGGSNFVTSTAYDRQGNEILITNPDNSQLKYIYTGGGLINQIQRKEASDAVFVDTVTNIDYAPTGQPTVTSYANGTITTNTYDAAKLYRLVHKVTTAPVQSGSSSVARAGGDTQAITQAAAAPIITSFTASPATITYGESTTLSWTLAGGAPNNVSINNNIGSVLGTSSISVSPNTTKTYTLTAKNGQGIVTASVTVTVRVAAPVITPNGGSFTTAQSVSLSSITPNAVIRYTTNGTTPTATSPRYTAPFTVTGTTTVKAYAKKTGMGDSEVSSAIFTIGSSVQAPTISSFTANPATIVSGQSTTLSWVLGGGSPTSLTIDQSVGNVIGTTTKSVSPATTTTYTLTASNSSGSVSRQVTVTITQAQVVVPVISPNGGSFAGSQTVDITTTTSGATIYYTLDGAAPTAASSQYTAPLTLTQSATLKAIAIKAGMQNSDIASSVFTITAPQIAFGPTIQDIAYIYDANGNITQIVDASQTNSAKTVAYTYDNLNRLLSATATQVASGQQNYADSYTYDALGNILTHTQTIGTNPATVSTYAYQGNQGSNFANPHAVTSITTGSTAVQYGYDKNGNQITEGSKTFLWNYRNELTAITGGGVTAAYAYDPSGQRVKLISGSATVIYPTGYYNIDSAGKITKHFSAATVEGIGAAAKIYYNHADHLSGQGVTTDGVGGAVEVVDYYPFGSVRLDNKSGAFVEQRKYTGHEYDQDTNLIYANARYYNPSVGRFISQDAVFWTLPQEIFVDPQSLNSYAYARNNPLAFVDPDGNMWTPWQSSGGVVNWMGNGGFLYNIYGSNTASITNTVRNVQANGFTATNAAAFAKDIGGIGLKTGAVAGGALLVGMGAGAVVVGSASSSAVGAAATAGTVATAGSSTVQSELQPTFQTVGKIGEALSGLSKNFTRIPSATGTANYRIPDGLTGTVLSEVKNVAYQSYTNQLKDFTTYAQANGLSFELFVRSTTRLSGSLQQAVSAGQITLKILEAAKK